MPLAGSHRACTQEHSKQAGAVGGKICSFKRMRYFLALLEGCDWLGPLGEGMLFG